VAELQFHHVVLSLASVAGIPWFYSAFQERHLWSRRRRIFIGIALGFVFLTQTLSAFTSLSSASSVELFGFIGCMLGCLGAVRLISHVAITPRGASTSHET